jgi:branched-chain amino acid transport system ATP-binding protein
VIGPVETLGRIAAGFGRRLSEHRARPFAAEAPDRSGPAPIGHRLAGSLTRLDRKRLELARLLLLEEIVGGLTEAECQSLIDLIRRICTAGTTIVWVEHVLHALLAVVDTVMVLDFGKVIAEGPPFAVMRSAAIAAVTLGPDVEKLETLHG